MSDRKRKYLNILLNICIILFITGLTYSWMLTEPSSGEIVDYDKDLIITSSDVDVDAYAFIDGAYVEQTVSPMEIGLLAPGVIQRYRFDITNNNAVLAKVKVVFSDITGDMIDLGPSMIFGSTSPEIVSFNLEDRLAYNATETRYYLNFMDEFSIAGNSTISLYWYIAIDDAATNEIQSKSLLIDKILFIKP